MAVHSKSKVAAIQFGIHSPDEIRRKSVVQVTSIGLYEGENSIAGGLFDPRMGVLDYGKLCPTDGLNSHDCPGYFGHIELATPVFNIQFMKYIIGTLKCVCRGCGKLIVDPSDHNVSKILQRKKGIARFSAMQKVCEKAKGCSHCKTIHYKSISHNAANRKDKEQPTFGTIQVTFKVPDEEESIAGGKQVSKLVPNIWTAKDVLNVLQRVSDKDCSLLGYDPVQCRPDWLICQVLPVCPPTTRPSVNSDNKSRMEDDLTHKYCDIIKINKALKNKLEKEVIAKNQEEEIKNSKVINDLYQLLQYHVATLVNNKISGLPPAQQRSGRPLKSIQERIKYKDGRIRGNLMGKRVDYSARSVITPDPNIGIFELGVPEHVAQRMTIPIHVNPMNRAKLTQYVRAGHNSHPGAKSIKKKSGRIISLRVLDTSSMQVEVGDIVNRYLMDGDFVLFNRQPSLHKMSMQVHKVRILPYKTFRLNVQVTTPYNADFDGDEMNMHSPQSKQSQVEIVELAAVPKQILSPGTNAPVIGIVQDTLIGSYQFTQKSNYLSLKDIEDLASMIPQLPSVLPEPCVKAGTKEEDLPKDFPLLYWNSSMNYWKGITIFSYIVPIITMTKATNTSKLTGLSEDKMRIIDGVLKTGVMDKSILGTKENGLIHRIVNDLGTSSAELFLDDCQRLVTGFMLKSGYSVGISDLVADDATLIKMKKTIEDKKSQVIRLMNQVHQGVFENNSGQSNRDEFELQVMSLLNQALSEAGKTGMKTLDSDNRMLRLVQSGSKGSTINIGQMIACVGQQSVDGKRIPYGFSDRTLPHFHKFDDGPTARGFVENSFLRGLRPDEFFFHSQGGREGLIDTAVKTAQTGYIQRKMVKGMEDIHVEQDQTVRDANKRIVQFQYGYDGLDGTYLERQVVPVFQMNLAEMVDTYTLAGKRGRDGFTKDTTERLVSQLAQTTKMLDEYMAYFVEQKDYAIEHLYNRQLEDQVYFCANIPHILSRLNSKVTQAQSDMTPLEIEKIVKPRIQLWHKRFKLPQVHQLMLVCYLHPLYLVRNYKVTAKFLEEVLETLENTMVRKRITPGESVGTIAAQSIGEPSTQMTLNSFTYETPIIVRNISTKEITQMSIGEFVKQCENISIQSEYYTETDTTWAKIDASLYEIMSVDEDGNVEWKSIEAGTKHPVINEDGTDTMICVETSDCQTVTATKAKSFLRLVGGKILPVRGDSLEVGDYIPVSRQTIEHSQQTEIQLNKYLSQQDYSNNKTFAPNTISLDYTFGYLLGACCAKGSVAGIHINISNSKSNYLKPIEDWCTAHNIEIEVCEDGIRISNLILRDLVVELCDLHTLNKSLNSSIIFSNQSCKTGFLVAYFAGCGYVKTGDDNVIMTTSNNKTLLESIELMLRTLGIFSYHNYSTTTTLFGRKIKDTTHWCLKIGNKSAVNLALLLINDFPDEAMKDLLIDLAFHYYPMTQFREEQEWVSDLNGVVPRDGRFQDIEFVKITSIKEVPNTTKYAYDLTVKDTKNFALANQLLVRDTFHFAGVSSKSNVTRGIPRLEELLDISKKIKSPYMQIELLPEYAFDKESAMKVMNEMSITRLRDVIEETAIYFDPESTHHYTTSITEHQEMVSLYNEVIEMIGEDDRVGAAIKSPWVLHMKVNRERMYSARVSMQDIRYAIDNAMNSSEPILQCLVADDNSDDLVVRVQILDDSMENKETEIYDTEEEEENNACHDMIDNLKTLEKTILENVVIRGIPGIRGASMSKQETLVKKDGDYEKMTRWVIDTDGENMWDVLMHPAVDTTRTFCNQIHTMTEIYGIEAARSILFNEIKDVFEFNDAYVNTRHIMLLVDVMTYRGITMSINRHGINNSENGPLAKCSFEESTDVIAKSAIFGGLDPMLGVSANIMMGQEIPVGTGSVDLVFDEENFHRWKKERQDRIKQAQITMSEESKEMGPDTMSLETSMIPSECTISSLMFDV